MSFHLEGDWVNAKAENLEGEEGPLGYGLIGRPRRHPKRVPP